MGQFPAPELPALQETALSENSTPCSALPWAITVILSDRGKLLWVVSLAVPLGGCSDLNAGGAFAAVICAIAIAIVLLGFIERCVHRSLKQSVGLDASMTIAMVTSISTVLARTLGFEDERLMNRIGSVSFVILGLCMSAQAVLELFDVQTDFHDAIETHGKRWLIPVFLFFGLFVAAIGTVEFMRSL